MRNYPVSFDVVPPERWDRLQVVLRLLIGFVMGMIGISLGWVFLLLYFALPVTAAIAIEARGADAYVHKTGSEIARFLRWLVSFSAYMAFLVDRFPTGESTLVHFAVEPVGTPTVKSAVARLLTSLPEAIALAVLFFISGLVWFLSLIFVLIAERVPEPLYAFQRGVLRWEARLLAYHASLVEPLPPFAVETGPGSA